MIIIIIMMMIMITVTIIMIMIMIIIIIMILLLLLLLIIIIIIPIMIIISSNDTNTNTNNNDNDDNTAAEGEEGPEGGGGLRRGSPGRTGPSEPHGGTFRRAGREPRESGRSPSHRDGATASRVLSAKKKRRDDVTYYGIPYYVQAANVSQVGGAAIAIQDE